MHPVEAVAVSGDNQAVIALAYNPENHDKVKHVERRYFFIREKVEDGRYLDQISGKCTVNRNWQIQIVWPEVPDTARYPDIQLSGRS